MNNNSYTAYLESGKTLEEFAAEMSLEWFISAEDIIKNINADIARHRKPLYPILEQQLDALWHDIDNGTLDKTGQFYTMLKEIKDNNPKP